MAKIAVAGSTIWLAQIADDQPLVDRLRALLPGEPIDLEIAGTVGGWERIIDKDGSGQPRDGIRPIGPMRETWERLLAEGSGLLDLRPVAPSYLATFGERLLRWDIPESRVYTTSEN